MPIVFSSRSPSSEFHERLSGYVDTVLPTDVNSEDLVTLGLYNQMPESAIEQTERHWLKPLGDIAVPIICVPIRPDGVDKSSSRFRKLGSYIAVDTALERHFDGMIFTGANRELRDPSGSGVRELLPFDQNRDTPGFRALARFAYDHVRSSIYSCYAAQQIGEESYGIHRTIADSKVFGVYMHQLLEPNSVFMRGMAQHVPAPHSHLASVSTSQVNRLIESKQTAAAKDGLRILASNPEVGPLALERRNGRGGVDLLQYTHLEYSLMALLAEGFRDGIAPENIETAWDRQKLQLMQNFVVAMGGDVAV